MPPPLSYTRSVDPSRRLQPQAISHCEQFRRYFAGLHEFSFPEADELR